MLQDDREWYNLFNELSDFYFPRTLRETFVSVLLYETPSDPAALWNEFRDTFSEDFMRTRNHREAQARCQVIRRVIDEDYYECLFYIKTMLEDITNGIKSLETFNLPPIPAGYWPYQSRDDVVMEDTFDLAAAMSQLERDVASLNEDQYRIFRDVIDSTERGQPHLYFVDGPAGSGKSFVFNTILLYLKVHGMTAIASASSGIAAIVLRDGRTNHNAYGVPFLCFEDSQCSIPSNSIQGRKIRDASLLLIDEVSMVNKNIIGAIDRLLKQLCNSTSYMGGKTVLFGGDWRQVLPVVQHGSRAEILQELLILPCGMKSRSISSPLTSVYAELMVTQSLLIVS